MCESRTIQLPSLHNNQELISILTLPLLIQSHILFSCYHTNKLKPFKDLLRLCSVEEMHLELFNCRTNCAYLDSCPFGAMEKYGVE